MRFTTFFELAAALALRVCLTLLILAVFVGGGETTCLGGRPRFLRAVVVYAPVRDEDDVCWRFAMRLGGRVNFILRDGMGGGGGVG